LWLCLFLLILLNDDVVVALAVVGDVMDIGHAVVNDDDDDVVAVVDVFGVADNDYVDIPALCSFL
jgi:hypothetical protein